MKEKLRSLKTWQKVILVFVGIWVFFGVIHNLSGGNENSNNNNVAKEEIGKSANEGYSKRKTAESESVEKEIIDTNIENQSIDDVLQEIVSSEDPNNYEILEDGTVVLDAKFNGSTSNERHVKNFSYGLAKVLIDYQSAFQNGLLYRGYESMEGAGSYYNAVAYFSPETIQNTNFKSTINDYSKAFIYADIYSIVGIDDSFYIPKSNVTAEKLETYPLFEETFGRNIKD